MTAATNGATSTQAPVSAIPLHRQLSSFLTRVREGVLPHWHVIRLLPGVGLPLTAAVTAGVLLAAVLPIASTLVTGILVGLIPPAVAAGPDSGEARSAFITLGLVGALFVTARAIGTVRATVAGQLGRRLDERLRERVMLALNQPIGIAHLEDPALRDHIERAQGIMGYYTAGVTVGPLANMASLWLQSIGSALILARFSPALAIALFVTLAITSHYLRTEYVRSIATRSDFIAHARRANYLRDLALVPGAGKELRLWGMLDWLTARFTDASQRVISPMAQDRQRGDRVHGTASIVSQAVSFAATAAVALAAARREIDLTALATYLGAVAGVAAINHWGEAFAIAYGTAAEPAVRALERATAEVADRETLAGTTPPTGMPREGIHLQDVSFRYAGRDDYALEHLDLFIPAGKSLAVVGTNGAGKTTLVKLISRLYDPTDGTITVDGVPLSTIEPRAWQRRVSAIFQDFVQYHLSVRDNVAFGAIERAHDQAALVAAAQRSGALDLIESLPGGWDTPLSRQYTGGADLSGGQWQRLALARALFAVSAGASVLILDEPTANLDVRAEAALYDRFLDITRGLTTVLISHRFSTVRRADRIVVLEGGRVVEEGSHDELMALSGRYAEMFTLQASRFAESAESAESAHV